MRHLIERVLELADEEEGPSIRPTSVEEMESNDAELKRLLESLQPRIRVYGVGGAGCMRKSPHEEGLFENRYVTGHAINTDAQALLMSPLENKILIGRTARGEELRRPQRRSRCSRKREQSEKNHRRHSTSNHNSRYGGGSGTGAAGHIARLAKEQGALTVAVVDIHSTRKNPKAECRMGT